MRKAYHGEIVVEKDNSFKGIFMGSDATAEHEMGIQKILNLLGVGVGSSTGIEHRTNTKSPEDAVRFGEVVRKGIKYNYLICSPGFNNHVSKVTKDVLSYLELEPNDKKDLFTSWDDMSFGIVVHEKYSTELSSIYKAIKQKELVITFASFGLSMGLCLYLLSNITEEEKQNCLESDSSYKELMRAFKKTKIEKNLEKVGKRYYALMPKWVDKEKKEIKYWLNPYDQHKYNSGWFTLNDLKEWVKEEGRIIKIKNK